MSEEQKETAGEMTAEAVMEVAAAAGEASSAGGRAEALPVPARERGRKRKERVKPQEVVVVRLKLSFFNILSLTFQIFLAFILVGVFLAAAVATGLYFLKDFLSGDILSLLG